jgi:CubicO group peptidase (beta-lactamase class C family)
MTSCFEQITEKNPILSGVILIKQKNHTMLEKTFGTTSIHANSLFPLASISKLISASLLLRACWDHAPDSNIFYQPIASILNYDNNYFGKKAPAYLFDLSIEELLSHKSGLRCYSEHPDFYTHICKNNSLSPVELIRYAFDLDLSPRGNFKYSNTNFALAGLILEKITNASLSNYINYFASKFNLKNTYLGTGLRNHNLNLMPGWQLSNLKLSPCDDWYLDSGYAGYGLISNAHDLALFFEELFIRKNIIPELLLDKLIMLKNNHSSYSSGCMIKKFDNSTAYYHDGAFDGVSCTARYLPKHDTIIIILSNNYINSQELDAHLSAYFDLYPDKTYQEIKNIYLKNNPEQAINYQRATVYALADLLCQSVF